MSSDLPVFKHDLRDILSLLMDECDIDDAQLSRETGVPASTISRMRINSNANPTASTLRPISKYFSVSISQLLGDEALPKDRLPGVHNPTDYTSSRMPVIQWDWIASWMDNQCEPIKSKLRHWISTEKEVSCKTFALLIPTNSFGLAFRKGSTIIVDPARAPLDGDLILIQDGKKDNILLRQFLIDGNERYLRSVNPEIKKIESLSMKHKIIGVVIETRFSLQESEQKIENESPQLQKGFTKFIYINSTQ